MLKRNAFSQIQKIFFLLLYIMCAAGSLHAQLSTGTILGSVNDASGASIPDAEITALNLATDIAHTTTTNSAGFYKFPNLQIGVYQVTATAKNFSKQVIEGVTLNVGASQEVDIAMKVGSAAEKVEVTANVLSIDLSSSTVKPVVERETIVELPLNGRDWTQLANLQPGVAAVRTQPAVAVTNQRANRGVGSQLTVSGARPQQNNYHVDGISINDYSNGGPGGVIGSNLGVDAIQEFSVVTGNATADYGKTAGGVINAVTRAGTKHYHGSVYEFLRNSALDARNEFDAPSHIAPFRRNQFGGSLGGPILKDKLFAFGDYEGLRQYQAANVSSNVPTAAARNGNLTAGTVTVDPAVKPYLNFYPLPNGTISGDVGAFLFNDPQISHENFYTIRADGVLSTNDTLTGTYFHDSGDLTSPDPFNVRITGNIARRQLATISESHTFGPRVLNVVRLGYSRVVSIAPTTISAINSSAADTSLGFVPGLPVGLINIGGISNFQGGMHATGEFDFHYNSYQVYDDLYWTLTKHSLTMGFSFERMQNNQLGTSNPNGQYIFSSLQTFLTNHPTSFNAPLSNGVSPRDLRQSVFGGYITDDYRIFPTLTLNLGMRYEPVSVPTETANRLAILRNLTDTSPHLGSPYFSNPSYANFSPRVGFAWDPFNADKTSVRGGFGLYDSLPLNYLFEGLSIFTAPYLTLGNVAGLGAGSFPKTAYSQMTAANLRYAYAQPDPKRSYIEQYGLNIQQQILGSMTAQIGYMGSHGVHLPYRVDDVNTVQPISTAGGYFFPTPSGSGTRLNPNLGQISAMFLTGYSTYNAFQANVTKRFSKQSQVQASYTWSKSIDDGSSSTFGDTFGNSVSSLPYWARDRRRGIPDFSIGQNIVLNYLFQLPYNPKSLGVFAVPLKGWQWGGIFQASSGEPFTPLISGDPLGLKSNDVFDFPDRLYGSGCTGNPINPGKRAYVKTQCFAFPNPGTRLGTAGRNSIIGPGLATFDTSFVKNNLIRSVSESFNVQFRAEFFNILNHVNYATPPKSGTQLFSASGAALTTGGVLVGPTASSSRQMQFALKIYF